MTNISLNGTNVSGYEVNSCLVLLHTFLGCSHLILHINYSSHQLCSNAFYTFRNVCWVLSSCSSTSYWQMAAFGSNKIKWNTNNLIFLGMVQFLDRQGQSLLSLLFNREMINILNDSRKMKGL